MIEECHQRLILPAEPGGNAGEPDAKIECCMVRGNVCSEAYTAGGEAAFLSLEKDCQTAPSVFTSWGHHLQHRNGDP